MKRGDLAAGISAYAREQRLLLRLLRRRGSFTADQFDAWFMGRERRRHRLCMPKVDGDSFILGMGINGGTYWAFMLELLQCMMMLGLVTTKRERGVLTYLPVREQIDLAKEQEAV